MVTFVEFFKKRTDNALTLCTVSLHQLDQIVNDYYELQKKHPEPDPIDRIQRSIEEMENSDKGYHRPVSYKVDPKITRAVENLEDLNLAEEARQAGLLRMSMLPPAQPSTPFGKNYSVEFFKLYGALMGVAGLPDRGSDEIINHLKQILNKYTP